jgi:hypothetical protein
MPGGTDPGGGGGGGAEGALVGGTIGITGAVLGGGPSVAGGGAVAVPTEPVALPGGSTVGAVPMGGVVCAPVAGAVG